MKTTIHHFELTSRDYGTPLVSFLEWGDAVYWMVNNKRTHDGNIKIIYND